MSRDELPYYDELMDLLNRDNYFSFNRKYVTVLGLSRHEALFLQDLINHYSMPNTARDGNYFLCTTAYLETSLAWSKDTQKDLLKSLRERGYIDTMEKGMPKRRWVRIVMKRILADFKQKASNGREKPPTERREKPLNMGGKSRHKELRNEERRRGTGDPPASGGSEPPPSPSSSLKQSRQHDEECRLAASRLRTALRDAGKVVRGNVADKWEDAFRLLRDVNKAKDWRNILDWFCDNLSKVEELRLPRIANGKEFRARFDWIERVYLESTGKGRPARKKFRTVKSDDGRERRVYEDDPEYNEYYDPDEEWRNRKPIGYFPSGKPYYSIYEQEDDED